MAKSPQKHYQYTTLQHLPDSGRVNVYGVVRSITALTFGGQIIQIADEGGEICVRVKKESDAFFKQLQVNDILRLHRVEVGSYCNEQTLIVEIGVYGCHAVAWSGSSNIPTIMTSRKYTFDDHDAARLPELRNWSRIEDIPEDIEVSSSTCQSPDAQIDNSSLAEVNATIADSPSQQSSAVSSIRKNSSPMKVPGQSKCVMVQSTSRAPTRQPKPCITVESASEIPDMCSKFFNWYAEVLGVYKGKGEPFTVFVKVWDGTLPSFPESRNMFRADSSSIEITYCEGRSSVLSAIDDYTIDVCCYGEWARKAMGLKVGDVVFFSNIRNYICKSKNSSALTMHEGGTNYDRALTVVDENDPVHFDISKRCADTVAEYLVSESGLIDSASGLNVTPIRADDVVAQSTPMVSKRTNQACPADAISSRNKEAGGLDIADDDDGGLEIVAEEAVGSVPLDEEVADPAAAVGKEAVGLAAVRSPTATEEVPKMIDIVEIVGDKLDCLPEDIRKKFLEQIVAVTRQYEREFLLNEFRTPMKFQYSLTDEMEEILKMEVGQYAGFLNFVEPELNQLKSREFLRNAMVYTAVCAECGEEAIVERCSEHGHWCQGCFRERKELRLLSYAYRIQVPAVYLRRNGQQAELLLAVPGHIWAAIASANNNVLMSEENVVQLYNERDLERYIKELNKILRFAEAVMTKMKISNVRGKIVHLNRETGSIAILVDHCAFIDRAAPNEILL